MTTEPTIPAGWVTITPNQVYDELRATHNLLGEMRADIREVLRRMEANTAQVNDHEIRLRAVEDQAAKAASTVKQHSGQLAEVVSSRRYRITTTIAVMAVLVAVGSLIVALVAVLPGGS